MDKNANSFSYTPPRLTPNRQVQRPPLVTGRVVADTSAMRSFEKALDRKRDSLTACQQTAHKKALVESSKGDSTDELGGHSISEDSGVSPLPVSQTLTQLIRNDVETDCNDSLSTSDSLLNGSAGASELQPRDASSVGASELRFHDASSAGVEFAQSAVLGIGHSEAYTPTQSGIAATTLHGALTAESMSSMMKRLERMATTHNGQWRFAILDNPMGVLALQMQRSAQGVWRVGISLNQTAELDELARAEELKAALLTQGHNVDSVTISRLSYVSECSGQ